MKWTFDLHVQAYRRSDGAVITLQAIADMEDAVLRDVLLQALHEVCA